VTVEPTSLVHAPERDAGIDGMWFAWFALGCLVAGVVRGMARRARTR
jgi:hypothetical protein